LTCHGTRQGGRLAGGEFGVALPLLSQPVFFAVGSNRLRRSRNEAVFAGPSAA
jgi:hypothetical protein